MNKQDQPRRFSKSRLKDALDCSKKVYLQTYHKDRAETSADTEASFKTGNDVGDIAKEIYGTPDAFEIEFRYPMSKMVEETSDLIDQGFRDPIFEATFQHEGVLVRVDLLLPDGDGWRAVEVKSSKSVKDDHEIDCAIQLWVMRGAGLKVNSMALGYIDGDWVYQGDGNYSGLLIEKDLTARAAALEIDVIALLAKATEAVSGEMPDVPVGFHCEDPYACAFAAVCWPRETKYPIRNIGGNREKIFDWVNRGLKDVRDIPKSEITAARQQRVHRITCDGNAETIQGAKEELEALGYPRYHLDFETAMPGIPIFKGSKPYKTHAVQWSIHVDDGTGDGLLENTEHYEFLDLSGEPPMRPLAEALIENLGDSGPVFMWHHYERDVIRELIRLFPDLEPKLQAIVDRLHDLKKIVERHYYHPDMKGSFSIKDVAPVMAPHMDYANLSGINEGSGAAQGYVEAVHPNTTPERKAELEEQLLRYCKFDTEAMVEIARFLEVNG
jgi:CRISPR/Cas system-associated exonuclease Cas4 (RecB family)